MGITRFRAAAVVVGAALLALPLLGGPASAANAKGKLTSSRYFVSATVEARGQGTIVFAGECGVSAAGSEEVVTRPPADGVTVMDTVWEFRAAVPKGGGPKVYSIRQVRPAPGNSPGSDMQLPRVSTQVQVKERDTLTGPCLPPEQPTECAFDRPSTLTLEIKEGDLEDMVAGSGQGGRVVRVGRPIQSLDLRAYSPEGLDERCKSWAQCEFSIVPCSITGLGEDGFLRAIIDPLPWGEKILRKFSRKAVDAGKADFTISISHEYSIPEPGGSIDGTYDVTLEFARMP